MSMWLLKYQGHSVYMAIQYAHDGYTIMYYYNTYVCVNNIRQVSHTCIQVDEMNK